MNNQPNIKHCPLCNAYCGEERYCAKSQCGIEWNDSGFYVFGRQEPLIDYCYNYKYKSYFAQKNGRIIEIKAGSFDDAIKKLTAYKAIE